MRHKHYSGNMAAVLLAFAAGLTGCASKGPTELAVEPGAYPATFDAARRVLRDAKFDLERVDARDGIITTAAKPTAGLATPWDSEQQTAGQELEDLLQHQQRKVRITFEPGDGSVTPAAEPEAGAATDPDLLDEPKPTTMRVRVVIERISRPNWRVDSSSIRLSSYAWDPALAERAMQPRYETVIAEDSDCARRIVELIRARVGQAR